MTSGNGSPLVRLHDLLVHHQDPPALILHQHQMQSRKDQPEPRFRRASGSGQAASGQVNDFQMFLFSIQKYPNMCINLLSLTLYNPN